MIFSLFAIATAAAVKRATLSDIPSNCEVLDTLFLSCTNGAGKTPSIYAPQCTLSGSGFAACCATLPNGEATDVCAYDGYYSKDNGCKVLPTTLQLECYNNGGYSIASPLCSVSSDGSTKCCARDESGKATDQCSSSPAWTSEPKCIVLSDLTTQCVSSSGITRTPAKCGSIPNVPGGRKCCAQNPDGSLGNQCQAIA